MVGPRLPWLALGARHKPNSAKDSVQSCVVLKLHLHPIWPKK